MNQRSWLVIFRLLDYIPSTKHLLYAPMPSPKPPLPPWNVSQYVRGMAMRGVTNRSSRWDNSSTNVRSVGGSSTLSYTLTSRRLGQRNWRVNGSNGEGADDGHGQYWGHGQHWGEQQYETGEEGQQHEMGEEEQQDSELGKILILLIAFCDPVQGLANCLFFVFDIPSIRRRYAALVMMGAHRVCRFVSCGYGDDSDDLASFKYQRWLSDDGENENRLPASEAEAEASGE